MPWMSSTTLHMCRDSGAASASAPRITASRTSQRHTRNAFHTASVIAACSSTSGIAPARSRYTGYPSRSRPRKPELIHRRSSSGWRYDAIAPAASTAARHAIASAYIAAALPASPSRASRKRRSARSEPQ